MDITFSVNEMYQGRVVAAVKVLPAGAAFLMSVAIDLMSENGETAKGTPTMLGLFQPVCGDVEQ